jgi:hypothetical protein
LGADPQSIHEWRLHAHPADSDRLDRYDQYRGRRDHDLPQFWNVNATVHDFNERRAQRRGATPAQFARLREFRNLLAEAAKSRARLHL